MADSSGGVFGFLDTLGGLAGKAVDAYGSIQTANANNAAKIYDQQEAAKAATLSGLTGGTSGLLWPNAVSMHSSNSSICCSRTLSSRDSGVDAQPASMASANSNVGFMSQLRVGGSCARYRLGRLVSAEVVREAAR
jgi:hypothetical protein